MNKLVAVLFSFYIAILLYTQVFFVKVLTLTKDNGSLFWNHLAILIMFTVFVFFTLHRHVSVEIGKGPIEIVRLVLLSLALIGLVISMFYHLIPLEPLYHLPTVMDKLFASDLDYTLWLLAPLFVLFI